MASNGEISSADTEMAECDGEQVVTMMDVLKQQQEFEDNANAVLGASDEKECTYSQGYIKRQAIYSCMTCCPESKDDPSKRAGFCLACSLNCHENHDLVELYTKRNFRCDCGNQNFKAPCQFTPSKPDLNGENVYNQNFIGLYCICSTPYPEATCNEDMIQCVVCEDWWHASHLDSVVPAHDQFAEMICKLCMAKNEFLHDYSDLAVVASEVDVTVNGDNGTDTDDLNNGSLTAEKLTNGCASDEKLTGDIVVASVGNMETDVANALKEASPENTEASSTEKESKGPEKVNDQPEKLEENKSDELMDTDETDKAAGVIADTICEDKSETLAEKKTEACEPLEEKADSTTSNEETKQCSLTSEEASMESNTTPEETKESLDKTSEEKTEKTNGTSNKKADESCTGEKTEQVNEEKIDNTELVIGNLQESESKGNDESSAQTDSETANAQNITELPQNPTITDSMDNNENKVTISQEKEESDKTEASETSQNKEIGEINIETYGKMVHDDSPTEDTINDNEDETVDLKETSTDITESESNKNEVPESCTENKRKMSTEDVSGDISIKKPKLDDSKCTKPKSIKRVHKGATFWPTTFRKNLCTCNECISMYKDLSVLFLIDMEDTVFAYETLGIEKTAGKPNQYEKGLEALCSLGRIQQIDALTEYNKMRDKLITYLQSFKEKKEIVTEHDIKTFFAGMKPEKRTDGVYFCG